MSFNYVIKLLSHEHKNARSDANTERTDPQIFSDINCKHLGLIVLSDVDSGRKFNVCMINLNFFLLQVYRNHRVYTCQKQEIYRETKLQVLLN